MLFAPQCNRSFPPGDRAGKGKAMDLQADDLYGWELNNPDYDVFDVQIVEILGGCGKCEHAAECTTPCESMRRLVPKEGRVIGLGYKHEEGKPKISYFALVKQDEVKFIQLSAPDHYWATASYISHDQVPGWALLHMQREEPYKGI